MATQTTTPESATMTKSIEERLEECRLEEPPEKADVAKPVQTYAQPETEEKGTLKEEEIPRLTENETLLEQKPPEDAEKSTITEQDIVDATPKDPEISKVAEIGTSKEQDVSDASEHETLPSEGTPDVTEKRSLEKREALENIEKETPKGQETPKDDAPAEVADENVKQVVEEEGLARDVSEYVDKTELKIVEVTEVAVERTAGPEYENKTGEVPTTVVHEVQNEAKPSQSRPINIFHNVGSKMLQSVQKMKNAITGKSSK